MATMVSTAINGLPVLSYGAEPESSLPAAAPPLASESDVVRASAAQQPAPAAPAALVGSPPTPLTPAGQPPSPAAAQSTGSAGSAGPSSAAGPGQRKPAPRRPAKPLTPLEMRSKAVFRAMEKLLEAGAESEEQLWSVARVLSGDEYEQVAEERCLAKRCGNPLCSAPGPPPPGRGGNYRIDMAQHVVYSADGPALYCSEPCQEAVAAFARRLGSHAAAQHRFELLMRQAQQAAKPAANAATAAAASSQQTTPAASAAGKAPEAQQRPAAPAAGAKATQASPAAASTSGSSSSSDNGSSGDIASMSGGHGRVNWSHGIVPSQWQPMNGRGRSYAAGAVAKPAAAAPAPAPAAPPPPAPRPPSGRPGASPKGVLKKKFAAGTDKTPIMLAEVKERDPSMVAADTARHLAPDALRGTRAAGGSRTGPRAVEGYVPHAGRSQFHQLSAQQAQQVRVQRALAEDDDAGADAGTAAEPRGVSISGRRRVRFSDEEGGSLEMPSARELAAVAASASPSASPASSTSDLAEAEEFEEQASGSELAGGRRQGGRQQDAAAAAAAAMRGPGGPPAHPAAMPGPAAAGRSAGSGPGPASSSASSANGGAVLVFDIEDPKGPLEAAAADAGGLAAQFGRLRVLEGSAGPAGTTAPHEAQQPPAAAPSPAQPGSVEEALTRQMQASMRKLYPRLSAVLPAELDASLEAQLASDEEDADSAGWSSSSEDEGAAAGLGLESSDEDEGAGRPRSGYRMTLSFFGSLFSHMESWITEATLDHLAHPPPGSAGAAGSASSSALPPPSAHSAQIEATLSRFLAAALPVVAAQLRLGMERGEVERCLNDLLHTMRFVGPLPGFKAAQWQLVAIILLKALSLERVPALRPAFESRDGISRLNKALAEHAFTVEEFCAVLELLCPMD